MKDYLSNLALIDTINFCKAHGIDPSGTHLVKYPRKQVYALVKDPSGKAIVTTTFYKRSVPTHYIHSN